MEAILISCCAHDGADFADHAGTVAVVQQQHMLFRGKIHRVVPQPDDPRGYLRRGCPGNGAALPGPSIDQGNNVGKGVGVGGLGLVDHNAHLLGNQGGVDHVDILVDHAVEQGGQAAYGQGGTVVVGNVAGIGQRLLFPGCCPADWMPKSHMTLIRLRNGRIWSIRAMSKRGMLTAFSSGWSSR